MTSKQTPKFTIANVFPLWDNLLIQPFKIEEKGQFKRPQNEEDKSEMGEVIAVGSGTKDVDVSQYIKPGDIVLFNKYSSTPVDLGKALIVRAEDVVAVLRK